MSKPRSIEELSKNELLSLIYHALPKTLIGEHPCECAICGVEEIRLVTVKDRVVQMYALICDYCEKK